MSKKYKLTKSKKGFCDITFYQIEALKDFSDVKKGDKGGWIEKEENLSHEGDCWVYNKAHVFRNAKVFENAKILDEALVLDNAWIFGNAEVKDDVWVFNDAKIGGTQKVFKETINGSQYMRVTAK